jgi:hypothetical protein
MVHLLLVYLLKMVIFLGNPLNNQMVSLVIYWDTATSDLGQSLGLIPPFLAAQK